jgi:hypothetical protein
MAVPSLRHEIVLLGSNAKLCGRVAGNLVAKVYNTHLAALRAGTHADRKMQAEFTRSDGRGLLFWVIEKI